ncbi:MAG TPA: 1-deoxy-D-xylulose-5-phosphate synthase [Bacillota bacterium]|nr:1-deoxy-D-xylulose-5-phosphate synthase [Bacillota bacterium]HNT02679.1 1-deoxy-D-xylulose-5-phosphate synthase [Bacillota bacterium]HPA54198.1 1-deoxy-D-xylulose-5-phosphate synthase [Bacillota bacterium]HPX68681.1 1-deoxy-D-xylulose-5-phosphate synthase [Bacillota bacterium]HQA64713.1 1-deoxy-D-xylulose-5-phosphate synthase [Bacillota bacterium]
MLDSINSPADLKKLSYQELEVLSKELRDYVIKVVSENGGHLASNLGVVELTLALHRVFDTPGDKIVWDVGHQSYIHKIITGRRESFKTLRKINGISGFPKREESVYDSFETGHSSTSISAALGMAKARDLAGENYSVAAVIGDGALTGGMAFEALNHAGDFPTNLIVILNDNKMSISHNIGGLSNYLSKLRTEPLYFKMKGRIEAFLHRIPVIGGSMYRGAERLRDWMKYLLVPGVIFEELGFKYFGPINGHDIRKLEDVIKRAKSYNGYPVLIHVVTTKGKGYSIAENKPDIYHGISPFFIENGELKSKNSRKTYSEIFGDTMLKLADKDNKIVAVSAAMAEGTGLSAFASKYKDRFFDVGIAEQHAVTFCAGLASEGFRPVFAVYSTFLQRAYDQIIHDVCMQKLNVVFAIDRAGIVGSDGETHQGVFDITYLRHIPNIRIMSPKDGNELSEMLKMALSLEGPTAIRYPRGKAKKFEFAHAPLELGKSEVLTEGEDGVIISEGNMVSIALEVCEKLKKAGRNFTLVNARFIKPLDEELLVGLSKKHKLIYTLEDNVVSGGFGSSILELLSRLRADVDVRIIGFDDSFIPHGEKEELYSLKKIDSESVFNAIMKE